MGKMGHYRPDLKRLFDVTLGTFTLFMLAVPILIVAIVVLLKLGAPILFHQPRTGLHGKSFRMVKFRTMANTCDELGRLLHDDCRLTNFGRFLRSTSLDELPELWNVLKGDMSLVGPRPLLIEYLPLYSSEQARRHEVRPGITGWAQINGRNAISWEEKFRLDLWYVENQSLWLDLKILFLTSFRIFQRSGISAAGQDTMRKFTGSSVAEESS